MSEWDSSGCHNNRWGGKNNKRPVRRKQSNQPSNNDGGDLNKVAKLIIGGIFLYCLAYTGFGGLADTVSTVIDTGKSVREASKTAETAEPVSKSDFKSFKCKVDLDSGDVADILDYLDSVLSDKNIPLEDANIVILDYKTFTDEDKYKKKITDTLSKYSDPVTFVGVSGTVDYYRMDSDFEYIKSIVRDNTIVTSDFTSVQTTGRKNTPENGKFTVAVTFY